MPLSPPKHFWTPKSGNHPDEYEDASRVEYSVEVDLVLITICDGASEAAFSREWAQILTEAFINRPLDLPNLDVATLTDWLEPCELEWNEMVPWDRIPWHGEAKTRAGALATLLGLTVDLNPNCSGSFPWHAFAVGDCCMFVVRDGELELAFPMEESGQFSNTPSLICSNPANNGGLWEGVYQLNGEFLPGDVLFLASDAAAAWFLQELEAGRKPWQALQELESAKWEGWVQERRNERSMRNDDSTLLIIEVSEGGVAAAAEAEELTEETAVVAGEAVVVATVAVVEEVAAEEEVTEGSGMGAGEQAADKE